ncbi:PocR ligand-binding domain-containing protein [Pontiellaceae bacterium B12227]|nr:PocR ligand-binding domain-containing protein [Pontiellaceae bacterium B12227]
MEYIFSPEMLKLLGHFTSLTGVRIAFFSQAGEEMCIGKDRSICSYCSMRRREQGFNKACLANDQQGRAAALEKNGVHFYQCHAGLCEAVMPIRVGQAPIGYVMIGQFRLSGAKESARNRHETAALKKMPVFSREKVDDLLSMFEVLIHHIANHALVGRRDYDLLNPLVERMRSDPAESLTLAEAARVVGLSPSRLSHLFTTMMGTNFKRYQMNRRLELADRLMKANPDWRMARIAEKSGFDDPLYFSRAYKKHRGIPPSKAFQ